MASDEIVWDVINRQFCSFKIKTSKNQTFCRNEYNLTGFCNKQSCPLANSRYATIRSDPSNGRLYLYMKSIERSHMPSRWWERIRLSGDYAKALEQVDAQLAYWPKFTIHKCKQRLTRLTQVAIRARKIAREEERLGEKLVPRLAPKVRKREATRERKAEAAAKVERATERVLLQRFLNRDYGDQPLNIDESMWNKLMRALEKQEQGVQEEDMDEGIEEELEEEWEAEEAEPEVEYVSEMEDESDEELEDFLGGESVDEDEEDDTDASSAEQDDEDGSEASEKEDEDEDNQKLQKLLGGLKRKRPPGKLSKPAKKQPKGSKGPKREIEYVIEQEPAARQTVQA
jgi:protein MAK16